MQASMITSNCQPVTGNDYKFPGNLYSEYNFPNQGQYANYNLLPEAQYNLNNLPVQHQIGVPPVGNSQYVHDRLYPLPVPFRYPGVNYNFGNEVGVHNYDNVNNAVPVNETRLDSTISDNEMHVPSYEIVRRDRNVNGRLGGGVCFYSIGIKYGNTCIIIQS